MKYKEGDTVYLKRDKAVISQLYKSTTGEEGYILVKNDDNNHLYFAKEDEVELIEPKCKHEWKKYSLGRLGGITENHRHCKKCGIDEIEPEHIPEPTKMIEELDVDSCGIINEYNSQGEVYARGFNIGIFKKEIVDKLNEVIRYINKEV